VSAVIRSQLAPRTGCIIGNRNMIYNKKSFTLIELLVGIAIFSLVITAAVGLLTSAIRSQRKSLAIQNVQENARYLMNSISKEIRMGDFEAVDGESLTFSIEHPVLGDLTYGFNGTQILENNEPINSDEVRVEGRFFVDGETDDDNEQPRVTIIMKVKTVGNKTEEQAEINLQTTIFQRNLD